MVTGHSQHILSGARCPGGSLPTNIKIPPKKNNTWMRDLVGDLLGFRVLGFWGLGLKVFGHIKPWNHTHSLSHKTQCFLTLADILERGLGKRRCLAVIKVVYSTSSSRTCVFFLSLVAPARPGGQHKRGMSIQLVFCWRSHSQEPIRNGGLFGQRAVRLPAGTDVATWAGKWRIKPRQPPAEAAGEWDQLEATWQPLWITITGNHNAPLPIIIDRCLLQPLGMWLTRQSLWRTITRLLVSRGNHPSWRVNDIHLALLWPWSGMSIIAPCRPAGPTFSATISRCLEDGEMAKEEQCEAAE